MKSIIYELIMVVPRDFVALADLSHSVMVYVMRQMGADIRRIGGITYLTSERVTQASESPQNTLKGRNFNLRCLNNYLIIFSKNLNMSSYVPILVTIIV